MKYLMIRRVFLGVQALMLLGTPFMAGAQAGSPPPPPFTKLTDVSNFMCDIFNWLFYFLIIFSIVFVVFGAYRYLTSGGDPEAVRTANKQLLYAVVAVAIALLAKGIPSIVASILGTTSVNAC